MTVDDVVDEVRKLVQDTATPFRYSDGAMLGYVNLALKQIALLRPDLFTTVADFACAQNEVTQTLPAGATRLVEVYRVVGGDAIQEVVREVFDRVYPGWVSEASGTPTRYMRHPRNPLQFHLYPAPTSGVSVELEYTAFPTSLDEMTDTISPLKDAYLPAVAHAVVWLVESEDNEHVDSGRAKMFHDSFMQLLGFDAKAREVTDSESGATGLPPFA